MPEYKSAAQRRSPNQNDLLYQLFRVSLLSTEFRGGCRNPLSTSMLNCEPPHPSEKLNKQIIKIRLDLEGRSRLKGR